ncbi:hypothetical protein QJS66_10345 [Kocuria rhizophila]|nr:hypothetical protein QJS66_10345 [Kocuria rhizophila]
MRRSVSGPAPAPVDDDAARPPPALNRRCRQTARRGRHEPSPRPAAPSV